MPTPQQAVNPLDHGVVGDGSDDTDAWLDIITLCRNNANVGILVPEMYSGISAQLDFSGISLLGVGGGAATFAATESFDGDSMLILNGATSGGAGNQTYSNFRLVGNRESGNPDTVAGVILKGDVLGNSFINVRIEAISGDGFVLSGNTSPATAWPAVNTFISCYVKDCDGDAWVLRTGRNNKFISCVGEYIGGRCWNLSNADGGLARIHLDACWAESAGTDQTAVYINGDDIRLSHMEINGYGTNPANTGHGVHITGSSLRCMVEGGDISANRSGTSSVPNSVRIRIDAGSRHVLRNLPSSVGASDLSITQLDTTIQNSYSVPVSTKSQLHTSNAHGTIGAATTRYIQAQTGFAVPAAGAGEVDKDVSVLVTGRASIVGLFVKASINPGSGGGGQTYTVTVMKNGAPTSLTVTVDYLNYAAGVSDQSNEVNLVDGDRYSFKVVTSGSAATIPQGGLHISVGQRQ
jgi:hypothetical protein